MDFWERLDETIKARSLTRKDVAKQLNLHVSNFATWKSRKILPASRVLMEIAKILKADVGYLIYGKERLNSLESDIVDIHTNTHADSIIEQFQWEQIRKLLAGESPPPNATDSPILWLQSNLRYIEYISRLPVVEQDELWDIVALKVERYQLDYDGSARRQKVSSSVDDSGS